MIDALLRKLFVRRAPRLGSDDSSLLNYCLDLAQEWGKYWLKPIQPRLKSAYPDLPNAELDRLNEVAQAAMKFGHDLVYEMAEKHGRDFDKSEWTASVLDKFPWVDARNLRHLYSTGQYYAMKDGVGQ